MANLKLEGVENLLTELEKLGKEGEKIERIVLVKAGEKVKEAIVKEAPHRTGNLRDKIRVTKLKKVDGAAFVEVYPSKDAFYAAFLEFGTTKMKADPFMSRGYENSKEDVEDLIVEEIRKGLGL
ncbi:HK97-gp10 family putative phage morphogenesis protein [Tissierella sp.]|uniref:HK97-gp10 family putative phage morphogenesis protein n=1 Tax=Tissierella sp. TaxID=41274 RepID=UPI0030399E1D